MTITDDSGYQPRATDNSGYQPRAGNTGTGYQPRAQPTQALGMGASNNQALQTRLELIKSSVPLFASSANGIQAAMALAQSTMNDEDIVRTAKSQAAMMMTDSIKDQLDQEQDPAKKWQLWKSLDSHQQKVILGSGFVAPAQVAPQEDLSPLGITKHILGGLLHDVTQNPVTKPVLEAAGKPLQQVQHLYRAGALGMQEEGFLGQGGTISEQDKAKRRSLGGILHDAIDLWDRTGNGEKTFSARAADRAQRAMGDDENKYRFVQSMAAGEDVPTFLTKTMKLDPNDPTFADQALKYNEYLGDTQVRDTITDLKNNKISFGRNAASKIVKKGTAQYNLLSGGLDAAFDVVGDPVLWATEGVKGYRTASRVISEAEIARNPGYLASRVDYLTQNVPKFSAAMDQIALRLSTGEPVRLMEEVPSVRKGLNHMTTYFAENDIPLESLTRDHVVDYFKNAGGSFDLLKGNFSVPHFEGMSLPSYGKMQEFKSGTIMGAKAWIDDFRLADLGLDSMSKDQLAQVYKAMGKSPAWATMAHAQAGVGEFLKSLVSKVPSRTFMNPFDEKAPQDFAAMMNYTLPKEMQNSFVNDFLKAGNFEGRRAVYNSAIDAMWQYSGANATDYGQDLFRKITQGDQVYMGQGMDRLNGVPAGVLETDSARAWAIPSFPDMLKATKDNTLARKILDESNEGIASKFMNYWRPAVLVRIGFIPRSYGEEMLTFLHREGLGAYVKSQAALAATKDEEAWFLKPVNWMADSMFKHVPYVGDAWEANAHHMTSYADQYFKDFSEKLAGDKYMQAARDISRREAFKNAFSRETGTMHGAAAQDLGEKVRREKMFQKDANGDIVPANITFGQITSHMRGDAYYHHTVYREMMRVADSELAKPVMEAMSRSMGLEEGTRIHGLLKDTGFLPEMEPHIPMVKGEAKYQGRTLEEHLAEKVKTDTIEPGEKSFRQLRDEARADPELDVDASAPHHAAFSAAKLEHPNVEWSPEGGKDPSAHVYQYVGDDGTLHAELHARPPLRDDPVGRMSLRVRPGSEAEGEELTKAVTVEHPGIDKYEGYTATPYGAAKEFNYSAVPEMVPGEPIPRTDLNYGQALLRARQQIPNQVMPKFEWYLKHRASVSTKSVINELVSHGMEEGQAYTLVNEVIPAMSPRQATALFTQDGILERNLQARMLDPNQEFDTSKVPGYTSERYHHGTYSLPEDGKLRPIHYEEGNLYGPGFYTTDDPSLATAYTHKAVGATGYVPEARQGIFQLGWQGDKAPNLADLDASWKKTPQAIKDLIQSHFVDVREVPWENLWDRVEEVAGHRLERQGLSIPWPGAPIEEYATLGDFMETLSMGPRGVAAENSGPLAEQFIKSLQDNGYDGWTHVGGGRSGDKAHKVSIFFDTNRLGVLKAPGVKTVSSFLPAVRQSLADAAQREYEDRLLELWSEGGSTHNVGASVAADRLSHGDMGDYTSLMRRGQEVQGDTVATGPARGTRRLYTIVAPPEYVEQANNPLRFSPLGKIFDHEEGWVPISTGQAVEGAGVPREATTHLEAPVAHAGEEMPAGSMAWYTTDHNEAMQLQQKLLRYKPDHPFLAADLRVAYTDVPDHVYQGGQQAARTAGAGGLDPLAQAKQGTSVWLPKSYRKDYQALGDDYQLLEPEIKQGHVRLYRLTTEEQAEQSKYLDFTSDKRTADARLPFEEKHVKYVDIPHGQAVERGVDADGATRYMFRQEEIPLSQELDTQLGTGVATSKALQDWGHSVSQKVHQVFGGGGQFDEVVQDTIHKALHDDLRLDDLWGLTGNQLPEETMGPQILIPHKDNFIHGILRNGFDHITQAGDAMIRSPMFLHNYAKNMDSIRTVVERQLGDPQANEVINLIADHLGTSRGQAISAWHSLPEEVRGAVNPLEAAKARDTIPPNLRLLGSKEDLQKLANAADAIYYQKDPELVDELRREMARKKKGIRGLFPSIEGEERPSLDDLVDSYLNLPEKVRTNIASNGLPEVFPKELMGKEMPLSSDQWSAFRDALEKNKHIEDTIHQIATTRAINDSIPWVHNHHLRSQFQVHAKNFIPFWFAQENFIGRAANLVVRDPAVVRQAQLAVHGLQTFGAITTNQFGEDVFNIPFTGALMRTLSKGASIFGSYSIPMYDDFTGQVKYTLPGIDELTNVAPSFSPVAALPLQGISGVIPELKPISNFVSGERGQKNDLTWDSFIKQIMPSYAYSIYKGVTTEHPEGDVGMASSMIQTIQRMEAAGMGVPEAEAGSLDVPSEKMQEYLDRVANHTRLATIVKGIVGFVSPVSPSIDPVEQLSPEFKKLLRTMPLDDALTTYMAQHPDGMPYTVMKTKVTSGAPLPSTPEALAMMDQHPEFFNKYKNAAAWFLPQAAVEDQFSQDAYNQQLAMNLRVNKSPTDWYRDYYFAAAAPDYFATKEGYDRRFAAAKGNAEARQQLTDKYQEWKQQYFAQHPVFAEEIQSPEGQQRRDRVMKEMVQALDDPVVHDTLHGEDMGTLLKTFMGTKDRLGQFPRQDKASIQARQALKDQFMSWAPNYVVDHPMVNAFWQRVIQPEISNW